jgi:acyl-CoA reductase-like NAD-dependent aldehyde dehydrogenase
MGNAGQIRLAAKRIFGPAAMCDKVCAEMARLADATVVGDGLDPATTTGPIRNSAQYHKALGYLDDARGSGTIIAGWNRQLGRQSVFVGAVSLRPCLWQADAASQARAKES